MIELMASVAIFGLGIVMVADDFKEILMETEMAKQYVVFVLFHGMRQSIIVIQIQRI